jgi:hypothetical protein
VNSYTALWPVFWLIFCLPFGVVFVVLVTDYIVSQVVKEILPDVGQIQKRKRGGVNMLGLNKLTGAKCPDCGEYITEIDWLSATVTYEYSRGVIVQVNAEIGCDLCGSVFEIHQSLTDNDNEALR